MMKTWIVFFGAIFSLQIFAVEESVVLLYTGQEEGEYEAYYSCTYAREQAQRYMTLMGLIDQEIHCDGGLISAPHNVKVMKLTMNFNLPQNLKKEVEIKSDHLFTACALNTRIINELLNDLPQIKVLQKRARCGDPKNPFFYKLDLNF